MTVAAWANITAVVNFCGEALTYIKTYFLNRDQAFWRRRIRDTISTNRAKHLRIIVSAFLIPFFRRKRHVCGKVLSITTNG